jgi:hypothetical protein
MGGFDERGSGTTARYSITMPLLIYSHRCQEPLRAFFAHEVQSLWHILQGILTIFWPMGLESLHCNDNFMKRSRLNRFLGRQSL